MPLRANPVILACLIAVAASVVAVRPAFAALIDVQFAGNFSYSCSDGSNTCSNPAQTGAAFVGSTGDQWNYFNAASGNRLLDDVSGAASQVSINFNSGTAYTDGTASNNFYSTPYANLFGGYIDEGGSDGISITLSGLEAGQAFSLYTYSEQDIQNASGRSMAVDVNGVTQDDTQSGEGAFVAGATYLMFNGFADASGDVNIDISTLNGQSNLNGLQLQTTDVPEPASFAILGLGITGVMAARRRRQLRGNAATA